MKGSRYLIWILVLICLISNSFAISDNDIISKSTNYYIYADNVASQPNSIIGGINANVSLAQYLDNSSCHINGASGLGCYRFDGTNNARINVGSANKWINSTSWSIAFWFKPQSPSDFDEILGYNAAPSDEKADFRYRSSGGVTWSTDLGGSTAAQLGTNIAINNGWHFFVWGMNGLSEQFAYIDGILVDNDTTTISNPTSTDPLMLGCRGRTDVESPCDSEVEGLFDDIVATIGNIYTGEDVTYMYNGGTGREFSVPTTEFTLIINNPSDGQNINQTTSIDYTLINVNGTANCTLFNNDINIINSENLVNDSYSFSFNNTYWFQGNNTLNINCLDSSANITENVTVFVDAITPKINYVKYLENNILYDLNNSIQYQNNISFRIQSNDTNNYFFNFTIYKDGISVFSNQTINISTELFNFNYTIDTTSLATGLFNYTVLTKDAHTKNDVNYSKELKDKDLVEIDKIGKVIDDKVKIKSDLKDVDSFELLEFIDRKKFKIKFKNNVQYFYMYIEGNDIVDYVGDKYGYKGHFVIDNYYWYDLENEYGAEVVSVNKISDKYYKVLMEKDINIDEIIFDSIGIINTNSESGSFYIAKLNIVIRDQVNDSIIINKNASIEIISDSYTYNYTTNTGNDTISLPVGTYYFRYNANGYPMNFKYHTYDADNNFLTLYLLNSTTAQDCLGTVYNQLGEIQEEVLVEMYRYDLVSNSYNLVESQQSNFEGKVNLQVDINTEYYKFQLYYPFDTLKETTSPTYIYSCPITFQINTEDDISEDFFSLADIEDTILFNNLTNIFNLTYTDTGSIGTQYCLGIYKKLNSNVSFVSENCLTSSTGSIIDTVTPTNDTTYIAKFTILYNSYWYLLDSKTYEYYFEDNPLRTNLMGIFFILIITLIIVFASQKYILSLILAPLALTLGAIFKIINIETPYVIGLWLFAIIITFMLSRER